ncbi:MAG: hypothetical protein LKF47_01055 [Megasphaera sp.]|jgi:uncharacterized membrane protein YfcA|nr:hypothetical protein [Megasphaera sp.]MCI1247678.1 hypothetical protein [Megasphaera sp.]
MIILVVQVLVTVIILWYSFVVIKNIRKTKDIMKKEKGSIPFYSVSLMVIMFFATFGISDTALAVSLYKFAKKVDDKIMPGTVITESMFPMVAMALAFLATIEVDAVTLAVCIAAQSLGAYLGVRIIVGLDVHKIRYTMGLTLGCTALMIIFKLFFLGGESGSAIGLSSWRLMAAAAGFFIFGGLNMIGMGATVPNIAVLLLLGVDIKTVYPIVMAGNVISCGFGAYKFIESGQYTRKAVIGSVAGIIGVLAAVQMVHSMDVFVLQILMILLLIYCSFSMFNTEYKLKHVK